ncbi:MAG: UDP-N-acetylmuramoyl-tripeptide--D-alanyl-D-alanine ligase, partial [bacterium]
MEPLSVDYVLQAVNGRLLSEGGGSAIRGLEITGVSTDSRSITKGQVFFAIPGKRFDGHDFAREAVSRAETLAVVSRPLRGLPAILVRDTVEALGDLASAYREKMAKRITAVTGTNGKTTTKEMSAWVLRMKYRVRKNRGNMNNLIGLPLSLLEMETEDELGVFEMGMSERGEIARMARISDPAVGVITNLGPCHLESLGSVEEVARAKGELLDYLDEDKQVILNFDDPMLREMSDRTRARVTGFGIKTEAPIRALSVKEENWGSSFELESGEGFELPVPGDFNVYNALAAIGVGMAFGISPEESGRALSSFVPEKSRMGRFELEGVTLIDDSYNANPGSVMCALQVISRITARRKIVVLGDMLELGASSGTMHREIGEQMKDHGVDVLYLYGREVKHAAESARGSGLADVREFREKSELIA